MEISNTTNFNCAQKDCNNDCKEKITQKMKNPLIGDGNNFVVINQTPDDDKFSLQIRKNEKGYAGMPLVMADGTADDINKVVQSYVDMGQNPNNIILNGEKINYSA